MTDDAVEFTMERGARIANNSARRQPQREASSSPGFEHEDRNGFPDHIQRKYYVVVTKAGPDDEVIHARIYTDRKGEYLAFKDAGDRLSTRNGAPGIVRDMVAVAEHRGWEAVTLRGPVAFRREAWLEAAARGLTVHGYEPADLDHATLRKRLTDRGRQASEPAHAVTDLKAASATKAAEPSRRSHPDVDIRTIDGRTGATKTQRQDVTRNRRTATAERFRSLDRREAVRDPALAAAHSHVAVLERALKARFPQDERARHIMLDAARERVAEHLEQGRTFGRAEIRASERIAGKDTAEPTSRGNRRRDKHQRAHERQRDR